MPVAKKKNLPQPWLLRYAQCKRCQTSSCAVNMVASSLRWLHVVYLFWRWQAYPKIYEATCRASDVLQKMCKGGARTVDMGNLASRTTAGNATPCQTTTLSLPGKQTGSLVQTGRTFSDGSIIRRGKHNDHDDSCVCQHWLGVCNSIVASAKSLIRAAA